MPDDRSERLLEEILGAASKTAEAVDGLRSEVSGVRSDLRLIEQKHDEQRDEQRRLGDRIEAHEARLRAVEVNVAKKASVDDVAKLREQGAGSKAQLAIVVSMGLLGLAGIISAFFK